MLFDTADFVSNSEIIFRKPISFGYRKVKLQRPLLAFISVLTSVLVIVPMFWGIELRTRVKNEKVTTIVTQDNIQAEVVNTSFPEAINPMPLSPDYSSAKHLQAFNTKASYDLGSSGNKSNKPEKSISRENPTVKEKSKSNNSIGKNNEELLCQQLQETTTKIQENQIQLESVNKEIAITKDVSEQEQLKLRKLKLENDKSRLLKIFLVAVNAINIQDKNPQFNLQATTSSQENVVPENMLENSNLNEEDTYEKLYGINNCMQYNKNLESKMICLGTKSMEDEK